MCFRTQHVRVFLLVSIKTTQSQSHIQYTQNPYTHMESETMSKYLDVMTKFTDDHNESRQSEDKFHLLGEMIVTSDLNNERHHLVALAAFTKAVNFENAVRRPPTSRTRFRILSLSVSSGRIVCLSRDTSKKMFSNIHTTVTGTDISTTELSFLLF